MTPRWPLGPERFLSTPMPRRGAPSPHNPSSSPAGIFRPARGTEVAGLPVGTRLEPPSPRELDGSLWEAGIWPVRTVSSTEPLHNVATERQLSQAYLTGPWAMPTAASQARSRSRHGASPPSGLRATGGGPPTPFEQLGLPPNLLHNSSVARLSDHLTEAKASEEALRTELRATQSHAAAQQEALATAEARARGLEAQQNLMLQQRQRQQQRRQAQTPQPQPRLWGPQQPPAAAAVTAATLTPQARAEALLARRAAISARAGRGSAPVGMAHGCTPGQYTAFPTPRAVRQGASGTRAREAAQLAATSDAAAWRSGSSSGWASYAAELGGNGHAAPLDAYYDDDPPLWADLDDDDDGLPGRPDDPARLLYLHRAEEQAEAEAAWEYGLPGLQHQLDLTHSLGMRELHKTHAEAVGRQEAAARGWQPGDHAMLEQAQRQQAAVAALLSDQLSRALPAEPAAAQAACRLDGARQQQAALLHRRRELRGMAPAVAAFETPGAARRAAHATSHEPADVAWPWPPVDPAESVRRLGGLDQPTAPPQAAAAVAAAAAAAAAASVVEWRDSRTRASPHRSPPLAWDGGVSSGGAARGGLAPSPCRLFADSVHAASYEEEAEAAADGAEAVAGGDQLLEGEYDERDTAGGLISHAGGEHGGLMAAMSRLAAAQQEALRALAAAASPGAGRDEELHDDPPASEGGATAAAADREAAWETPPSGAAPALSGSLGALAATFDELTAKAPE